ncbi:MAG: hypothetical protein H6975_09785 [Gammaproteobacteria bacterium]|nr:hypothetical protein [Gammaproteobacteria bacterium]
MARFLALLLGLCVALLSFSARVQAQAALESPAPSAFVRSGVGLIRGWACAATQIEISIDDGPRRPAGYGTVRGDTQSVCGDRNNGFGLTINWNNIGDGVHNLRAFADDVEFANVDFTVITLGEDFVRGLIRNYLLPNFPGSGQSAPVHWSESHQNFVFAQPTSVPEPTNPPLPVARAHLESPTQGSFESGVGLIRGWVCDATQVEISVDGGSRLPTAYGTPRGDTEAVCGDRNNGFGLTVNWNNIGDGIHNLQAFADGVEFASVNFAVTTLGEEFLTGIDRKIALQDFPGDGATTILRWSEPDQNFTLAETTATPAKLALVSLITDLSNIFALTGASTSSTNTTGIRAAKNARGQPTQLSGLAWADTQTRQAADVQLTADGLPVVYTDSAGVEARFSAFTDTTTTISFHDRAGNVQAGPVTVPIDASLILALQEVARRVLATAQRAETDGSERRLAETAPLTADSALPAATTGQVFNLSQLLANVYWFGSLAAGETVCAVGRAATAAQVHGLIAPTACQSPLITALLSRFNTRQGQADVPEVGVDPTAQQALRFDDDVTTAPCDPATDSASCLIESTVQLQEREQTVTPPVQPTYALTLNTAGTGSGAVGGGGHYLDGAVVNLTATPDAESTFAGWSPAPCAASFSMPAQDLVCTATFNRNVDGGVHTVTAIAGLGGSITPSMRIVEAGAIASFTVTPDIGYQIVSVTGCDGHLDGAVYTTGPITGACTVNASFTTQLTYALTLSTAGTGSGTVEGSGNYLAGTEVAIAATPDAGSTFVGWSPAPCATRFSMPAQDLVCTATFNQLDGHAFALSVTKAGNGEGEVTSNPSGIACGSQCSAEYAASTVVTLTARALGNSSFAAWSGACSGSDSQCVVTMDQAQSVTATFLQGQQGEVRFNLSWATLADLDLYVTDPCGNLIYYGATSATCQGATGILDIDANAESPVLNPAENIFWSSNPPTGQYQVQVCYFLSRDAGPSPYQVFIQVGSTSQTVTGSIAYNDPCQTVGTFTF